MTKLQIQTADNANVVTLQFNRGDDRWNHSWLVGAGENEVCLMTSVEGTPADVWPASPPLQDASYHELGAGHAILCVGMAGKSHWSAAYTVEQSSTGSEISSGYSGTSYVKSDLACQKVVAPTTWLGSSYVLADSIQVDSFDSNSVKLQTEAGKTVEVTAITSEDFETQLELSGKLLTIKPVRFSQNPKQATRWAFRIQSDSF